MIKLHVAHDNLGYYIADEDGYYWSVGTFATEAEALVALKLVDKELASYERPADPTPWALR